MKPWMGERQHRGQRWTNSNERKILLISITPKKKKNGNRNQQIQNTNEEKNSASARGNNNGEKDGGQTVWIGYVKAESEAGQRIRATEMDVR